MIRIEDGPVGEYNTIRLVADGQGRAVIQRRPGDVWELIDLFVNEDQRRSGVGTQLLKLACELVETGTLYLFTRRTNGVAREFYKSLGFFEVIVPGFYDDCDACLFLDVSKRQHRP